MLPSAPLLSGHRLHLRRLRGRVGLALVACLSFLAGMTDAIGFLATGDFVSFMSGNTTRLAVAISEGDLSMVLRLVAAVIAFIAGNVLGVLAGVATLLCIAAILPFNTRVPALLTAIIAMGMLNAAVEQVNGLPIGLTYVTGALSRFGRGLGRRLLGEKRDGWRVQLVPWCPGAGCCWARCLVQCWSARWGCKRWWSVRRSQRYWGCWR